MDISDYSIHLIEMTECESVLDGHIIPGDPLVSVSVITYNHGKYIRQCLDGILMQKVNFPYEVLVHDDASPDDTADIIREYEARFPTVIKPIYQTENQYSKHDGTIGKIQYGRAKGKYIAQCEGDDYWTDSRKLQMQVDFLEEHEEYIGTAHSVLVVDINGKPRKKQSDINTCYTDNHEYVADDLVNRIIPGQTASLIYRNIWRKLDDEILYKYYSCQCHGDRKLAVLLTMLGNIYCFGKKMSHYRQVTENGTSATATYSKLPPAKWNYIMEKNKREFAYDVFGYSIDFKSEINNLIISGLVYFIKHPSIYSLKDTLWVIKDSNIKIKVSYLIIQIYRKVINRIWNNNFRF